jgi:hypothetical protein
VFNVRSSNENVVVACEEEEEGQERERGKERREMGEVMRVSCGM